MADINSELANLTASVNKLVNSLSRTTAEMEEQRLSMMEMRDAEEQITEDLIRHTKLSKEDRAELSKQKAEVETLTKKIKKLNEQLNDTSLSAEERANKERELAVLNNEHSRASTKLNATTKRLSVDLNKLSNSTKGASLSLKNFGWFVGSYLVDGLVKQYKTVKEQNVANAGVVEGTDLLTGLLTQQYQAITRGIDPKAFGEMMTANRQMVNAIGGISNTLNLADPSVKRFYGMTLDLGKSMELTLEQMSRFAKLGIAPSERAMTTYAQDVEMLAKMVGFSADQAAEAFNDIATDTESIHLLRSARVDEREAILENQRALLKQNIALGMTTEQAKEAAKMLNKMVAAKPLERMKQAARMRAMAAAMGVGGGEEAARAMIAGPRATADQKKLLSEFSVSMTNAFDKMRGVNLQSEMFSSVMLDKMDPENMFGKGSSFSSQLGTVMADGQKMYNAYTTSADSMLVTANRTADIMMSILAAVTDGSAAAGGILYLVDKISEKMGIGKPSYTPKTASGKAKAEELNVGAFDYRGMKKQHIERYTGMFERGTTFTSDEAAVIKDKLGIDVPAANISDSAAGTITPSAPKPTPSMPVSVPLAVPGETTLTSNEGPAAEQVVKTAAIASATVSTAKGIQQQIDKIDDSNNILKKIQEAAEKQNELAERQLAATLMSEKERTGFNKSALLQGNSFAARYGYIPT